MDDEQEDRVVVFLIEAPSLGLPARFAVQEVRFAPADTGLDRPLWVARGAEVVVVPRRPGDRGAIGPGCVAAGLDQDTGCRDADRWLEANACMLRKLSSGWIDAEDFLALSWRVRGAGFARAR